MLRSPLVDWLRRNFDDSFSAFLGRYDEPVRLNGSGMKTLLSTDKAGREVSEDDKGDEGEARKSSLLQLSCDGFMDAKELERCAKVFSSVIRRPYTSNTASRNFMISCARFI